MKILTIFYGRNRVFRQWLAAGMPDNVVFMEAYKKKKTARKRPKRKAVSTSIPDGVA